MEETSDYIGRDFGLIWCRMRSNETLEMVSHPELWRKKFFPWQVRERKPRERRPKVRKNPVRTRARRRT